LNCFVRTEINGREDNEDSSHVFSLKPAFGALEIVVLAIADGMGGHAYGEQVSREVLRCTARTIFESLCCDPWINKGVPVEPVGSDRIMTVLKGACEQASLRVRLMVKANQWDKAGSTLTIAVVSGNEVVAANLGDSPLFHVSAAGMRKVTRDHTVASAMVKGGLIPAELERFHESRHSLEFFAGSLLMPRGEYTYSFSIAPDDLLLVCSDGVCGAQTIKELERSIGDRSGDLGAMADRLIKASSDSGESDNQTLILWRNAGSR